MSPAPGTRHQAVSRHIQFQLYEQLEKTGLAAVFDAPTDIHLDENDVVEPDLMVIDERRRSIIAPAKITDAPDLVVEILSESTAHRDRSVKRALYERAGVGEYWIVDPDANTVTAFKLTSEGTYEAADPVSDKIEFHTDRLHAVVDLSLVWRAWPFDRN